MINEECPKELAQLLGSDAEAKSILFRWVCMAATFGAAPSDLFTGKDKKTDAQRLEGLRVALGHINGLIPLLDGRVAWLIACYSPGMSAGPEVAEESERRIEVLKSSLVGLRDDVARTIKGLPPVLRGRKLELTPRLMLTIDLISQLKEAGLPMGTGERSKMVRALRVCWDAAGFEGDPRDLLRSLEKRRAQIAVPS